LSLVRRRSCAPPCLIIGSHELMGVSPEIQFHEYRIFTDSKRLNRITTMTTVASLPLPIHADQPDHGELSINSNAADSLGFYQCIRRPIDFPIVPPFSPLFLHPNPHYRYLNPSLRYGTCSLRIHFDLLPGIEVLELCTCQWSLRNEKPIAQVNLKGCSPTAGNFLCMASSHWTTDSCLDSGHPPPLKRAIPFFFPFPFFPPSFPPYPFSPFTYKRYRC